MSLAARDALRLLVVAEDPLARAGLVSLLAAHSDHSVTASAGDFIATLTTWQPDLILWDMGWNGAPQIERLADWEEQSVPVIALLSDAALAPDAWSAGARGLFSRAAHIALLLAAMPAVQQGLIVIDPAFRDVLLVPRERPALLPLPEALTARELEVLQYLARGLPNKSIARSLSITESTVKFHVNAILSKLGAQSRTDAVVRASRLGLVIL